jgi:hypothetical protein
VCGSMEPNRIKAMMRPQLVSETPMHAIDFTDIPAIHRVSIFSHRCLDQPTRLRSASRRSHSAAAYAGRVKQDRARVMLLASHTDKGSKIDG